MIKLIDILKELTEGKQIGTLYHFTTSDNFYEILSSNQLQTYGRYISFTRNKNLFLNPSRLGGGYYYCFEIDGDKLSTKYKLEPFNDPISKKDEYEERVVFNRNGMFIDNLDKYVKKIIILGDINFKTSKERSQENIDKITQKIQSYMDVPVEIIFKDSYPYKSSKELNKFQDITIKGQKPNQKTPFTTLNYIPDPIMTPEEKIQRYIKDRGRYRNVDLDLRNTPIKSLPNNLTVYKKLILNDTPFLKSLPDNLTADWIIIRRSQIDSIPYNLNVDYLMLEDIPLIKKYDKEQIKKMIEDNGGSVKRISIDT